MRGKVIETAEAMLDINRLVVKPIQPGTKSTDFNPIQNYPNFVAAKGVSVVADKEVNIHML